MSTLMQQVLNWLIPALCGGAVTLMGVWLMAGKALVGGVRELLLCKLEELRVDMVHDGGIADDDFKARSQRIYDCYHALGGNGHGTMLNQDIQLAPIEPRSSKTSPS